VLIDKEKSRLLVVDVQERLALVIAGQAEIERQCGLLIQGARRLGVPILFSEQYPKGLGRTLPALLALAGSNRTVEKIEFSCFSNPALRAELSDGTRPQTIVCGTEAHVCVLQTVLEMKAAGHDVVVVADAVGSRRPESSEIALERMRRSGVPVVTTEMVLFEWMRRADTPEFRDIARLVR
jgi:nicotinamidase-related amidase